ncbi:39S ribosomal protein L12, mitochondrial [Lamellibrachia satsuma]|nr:39S ribosomal protein L12, mitochondrial [Lamellibrachia satsuma]
MALNAVKTSCVILPTCIRNIARPALSVPSFIACKRWTVTQRRYSTAEALATPQAEGEQKVYDPKIQKLVEDIGSLTLLEVADLNELLKSTLKITDAPMMMGAPAAAAPAEEKDEDDEKPIKKLLVVKLVKFDTAKKVALIKAIKGIIPGMNLVQAKKFVESAPQVVQGELMKEEAEKLKEVIEAAGGETEIE